MTTTPSLYTQLPYLADSAAYFEAIRHLAWPVFLDSANLNNHDGRYDIIAADPFITLQCQGLITTVQQQNGSIKAYQTDPFEVLQNYLEKYHPPTSTLPFCGGAIGYFGYDLGRRLEQLATQALDAEHLPEMAIGLYDWAVVTDHLEKKTVLVSHGLHPATSDKWASLVEKLQHTCVDSSPSTGFKVFGKLNSNLDDAAYAHAFTKIKDYIREGDCYQVNLAKRYEIAGEGDPWHAYQRLRKTNAAPFSVFFETPAATILSSSPERLLQVHDRQVETKPIKGTRPRDLTDAIADQQQATALQQSVKDRAENLMIVDLLRNDLGKVSALGSIRVPKPFALESFATVHHLVSTITSELATDQTAVTLLRACFPGGSITGAPKLRAMQIIEELEPHRRGVYCGSIGYIGFDGNMDTNIAIRTLVFNDNRLRFWAGGGIVADSELAAEHQEVLDKAAAMLAVIESLRA